MRGDQSVINQLNTVLGDELVAINQSFLHARMCKNWGLEKLNSKEYKKSIKDMKQADKLIERVLFLEGIPNLQKLGKLYIGETVEEIIACDMRLVSNCLANLRTAIAHCEQQEDYVSRDLLCEILADEEEYCDWLETQQELIGRITIENYTQSMIGDD